MKIYDMLTLATMAASDADLVVTVGNANDSAPRYWTAHARCFTDKELARVRRYYPDVLILRGATCWNRHDPYVRHWRCDFCLQVIVKV